MNFNVSVSVLNVLVNIFVLFAVAVGSEIIRITMYKATQLQLRSTGKAPILADSDDTFTVVKQRLHYALETRSPIISLVVIMGTLLIVGEVCSEFGVYSSARCFPKSFETKGICAQEKKHMTLDLTAAIAAYQAENVPWDNEELVKNPIYEGLRHNYNGMESFALRSKNTNAKVIISNCSVSVPSIIPGGNARIMFKHDLGTISVSIYEIQFGLLDGDLRNYSGRGDVVSNSDETYVFIVEPISSTEDGVEARMFEYFDYQDIISQMGDFFKTTYMNTTFTKSLHDGGRTEGALKINSPALKYTLRCGHFADPQNFYAAAMIYRKVQLSQLRKKVQNKTHNGVTLKWLSPMEPSDVVRAGIASASTGLNSCKGETFIMQECGKYNVIFMLPLIALVSLISICAIIKQFRVIRSGADIRIPYTSIAWSKLALNQLADVEAVPVDEEARVDDDGEDENRTSSLAKGFYILNREGNGDESVGFILEER